MKRTLLTVLCALCLAQIASALDAVPNEDAIEDAQAKQENGIAELKTVEGAAGYITDFLNRVDPSQVLASNSAFIEKTNQNGDRFLLAKVLITFRNYSRQEVRGIVSDLSRNWTTTLSLAEYNAFLHTGDRAILAEPNLDPDPTPKPTPATRFRQSGEGHEDTYPNGAQIVNIRSNDVVVTTKRSSLVELVRLNGFHNKPAVRQLFNALVANQMAFTLNPGTIIYVQEMGRDGVDSILIRGQDREYFVSHTDVSEAINLGLLQN